MEEDKIVIKLKKQPLESERKEIAEKKKKLRIRILVSVLLVVFGFAAGFLLSSLNQRNYYSNEYSKMDNLIATIQKNWLYADQYDDLKKTLEDQAYYGMTSYDFDPYTAYMTEEEFTSFASSINMDYVGIGVQYSTYGQKATIIRVFKNSPADQAGIMPGDIIEQVDDVVMDEDNISDLKSYVQGDAGTIVTIHVNRGGEKMTFDVTRASVENTVYGYTIGDVGILEIMSFGESTEQECMTYLNSFEGIEKLIIDLRDNGGGYLTSVQGVAGLFVGDKEILMYQEYSDGSQEKVLTSSLKTYDQFKKIVILTNENTASASEVLTMCLKEHLSNTISVGHTSYGKGVVQSSMILSDNSCLKLTVSKWLSPNGVWINGTGIEPEIVVDQHPIIYETIPSMEENTVLSEDSVSEMTRVAQLCLDYMGYVPCRTDGYFSKETGEALSAYQKDLDLEVTGQLNEETYYSLISRMAYLNSTDTSKDVQLQKGLEWLSE